MFNDCNEKFDHVFFSCKLSMGMDRGDTLALVNASQLED